MSPTPPGTSSSGRSPEEQFRVVRKRNRIPLSCYPCRTRKLKCDRSHPCSNCVKREGEDVSTCSYATPSARKKTSTASASTPDDMQNRIDRLEGLVLSLMHNGSNVEVTTSGAAPGASSSSSRANTTPGETDPSTSALTKQQTETSMDDAEDDDSDIDDGLATSLGVLKVDNDKGKSMYIGQAHWHLILADISEVKTYFNNHKKELEKGYETVRNSKPASASDGPTLLFGQSRASPEQIRAGLPSKTSILTLCGRYFNSLDNTLTVVHVPAFQQQLRSHFQNPNETPLMWLGCLYAVLSLALHSYSKAGDEPPEWKGRALDMAAEYRSRTVQCLLEVDYTKPVEHTLETMLLYLNGEYSARFDADMALWLIGSLTTRVAFRLGYHRDPKWFPSLTPFQAEMRRRVWATVRMSDIFMSQHLALPAMIHDQDCDTELPSNVFDEDFGPETEIMPPPRPSTEPTPIAYALAKCRLGLELGNIIQVTGRVGRQVHYEEILRFDARLQEIMEGLPPHLKMTPLEGSQDPVSLLMARFSIDILYQKILCVLHRKYLTRARTNPRYAHSRRTAIEASLVTLQHLATLHRETQPNGRLRSVKWYISSTATKDFLLPAMMVVMDLHVDKRETGKRRESDGDFFWTPEQRMNMIGNLELTRDVWKGLADTSMEAFKASKVLEIMLEKIRSPEPSEPIPEGTDPFAEADTSQDMHPEHSAAVTLGMLSGGMTPNTAAVLASMQQADSQTTFGDVDFGMSGGTGMTPNFPQDIDMNVPQSPFSMFGNLEAGGDLMANFDWNAFESYTQSANWGAENGFGFLAPQQPDQAPSSQAQQPNNGNKGYTYPNPNASGL